MVNNGINGLSVTIGVAVFGWIFVVIKGLVSNYVARQEARLEQSENTQKKLVETLEHLHSAIAELRLLIRISEDKFKQVYSDLDKVEERLSKRIDKLEK